jgi:hypothetical protein
MKETRKGSIAETTKLDDDEKKILRVAAFIFSVYGDDAVEYARRLEAESAVLDTATRIRMEVERLVKTDAPASKPESTPDSLPKSRR